MTVSQQIPVATLGVPRIGRRRELKFALESYWSGKSSAADLLTTAKALRAANWEEQRDRGVSKIPSNDFSLYDHVLDTAAMVGAVPSRYGWNGGEVPLDIYFAMARGNQGQTENGGHGHNYAAHAPSLTAMEMTKWFDTNYHYIVPELEDDQAFTLSSTKPVDYFLEAKVLGIHTRPVILGPVTFLKLSKSPADGFDPLALLPRLLPIYQELLSKLKASGADWVQIDEPALVLDLNPNERAAFEFAYGQLSTATPELKIMLATYFGSLGDNLETAVSLPIAGLHIDLVRAPEQLEPVGRLAPKDLVLSLGLINGRNVWRANLLSILDRIKPTVAGWHLDRVEIAPSCSMLHVPIDLRMETALDANIGSWLAFAAQKTDELVVLARALSEGRDAVADALTASAEATAARATSTKIHDPLVEGRIANIKESMKRRTSAFAVRSQVQAGALELPPFPTTTIGSFPQTLQLRKARAAHAKGQLSYVDYETFLKKEIEAAIRWQEEIGLDVLVHGEFERNDMVQYFGEQLSGFAFTEHAWVQSYGSRYVRPPIIFGDVSRSNPMTVRWWEFAQSLTQRPVKGMLTGPVTILNWSFVRDDVPRSEVCRQIALAIRDEVTDLERSGARMIQIDEAAFREGLPLRACDRESYLDWAVECFRLASTGVQDATQIHTHMCYSEFNEIIGAIAELDADVISIETSRSAMELLDAFTNSKYPNEIGPGVYDIHSPRVPEVAEISALLLLARERLSDAQLWVNPDCGLKTRKWDEVRPALKNMVAAARALRERVQA
ncbi:5-methyltetrahydropteroyltriglutamate--homocysteine S-methyltransferase [Mesorhizobium atlanticum]|uniref:5-methyltetrahydropteroyltriglutamate--homocysteine methyltransferase n=1 Tax=Mesorhizobium atlanticum TaxID=2233532 RepID=A0A330GKC3_9HYPH|nr:5-methyltetrahydropteroyltriglutamate--homocysteine S-methyltransferase [Mesorhizobium atlanticum]RAZ72952.1 5-methyltetrahydropteroyltriglutamate--homocysteine S-methyltransferase [Mesorhizobium atlanticum]